MKENDYIGETARINNEDYTVTSCRFVRMFEWGLGEETPRHVPMYHITAERHEHADCITKTYDGVYIFGV